MSYYQVTQAAATVIAEDGTRSLLYLDDIFEGSGADEKHLQMLLKEGFVAEVEVIVPEPDGPKPGTADHVLAEVGDDKELAQAALEEENAKDKPRKGLVADLEKILASDGS